MLSKAKYKNSGSSWFVRKWNHALMGYGVGFYSIWQPGRLSPVEELGSIRGGCMAVIFTVAVRLHLCMPSVFLLLT